MSAPTSAGRTAVRHHDELAAQPLADGARRWVLAEPDAGSELGLERIELSPGVQVQLPDSGDDELLGFVVGGDGSWVEPLTAGQARVWRDAERTAAITAGADGLELLVARAGPGCDEHAALGERAGARLDLADGGESATGHRSFQVLLGPDNGCCRATMFVGSVPPGAAPWHFHQYDEVVCILDGSGTYRQASGAAPTRTGSAVRIPAREVHINENGGDSPMLVLGVFTPAGSPSAAYLADDPRPD